MRRTLRHLSIRSLHPLRPLLLIVGVLLLASAMFQRAVSLAPTAVNPPCHTDAAQIDDLPDTHYLYNERYGWFDHSHFNTGRPTQVLADVRAAVSAGGGQVTISQGVHDDITGYTGVYAVAGNVPDDEVMPVALGVYLDWSFRFEAWQAEPPQGLLGPTSAFAVEDLPSQYLGFIAAAWDVPVARLFGCYLGPVTGSEDGPPDIIIADRIVGPDGETAETDGWPGLARLANRTFDPIVPADEMWRYTDWPAPLQLTPLTTGPGSWQFVGGYTWFLGDDDPPLPEPDSRARLRPAH